MNLLFYGKGNCSSYKPLEEQVLAGAAGMKIHEDLGHHSGCHRRLPDRS